MFIVGVYKSKYGIAYSSYPLQLRFIGFMQQSCSTNLFQQLDSIVKIKKEDSKGWCKINSNLPMPVKKQQFKIKGEGQSNNIRILQHKAIDIQKQNHSGSLSDTQQSEINCDRQRKRRKALQKEQIIKLRDIFQRHQESTYPDSSFSNTNLAKRFNVSLSTVIRLRTKFHKDPTLMADIQKMEKAGTGRKRGSMNDSTKLIRCFVYNQLIKNRFMSRRQIQIAIENNKDIRELQIKIPSLKTISKIIQSLNLYRKRIRQVPRTTIVPNYMDQRLNFCQRYKAARKSHSSIIFIDLREIYLVTRPAYYAWVQRGSDLQLEIPCLKQEKVVILVGLNLNRIIQWQIKIADFSEADYAQSLAKILSSMLSRSTGANTPILLVINNKQQCQYQRILGEQSNGLIQLLDMPPCSPQLNPLEIWFQELRGRVKQDQYKTLAQLCNGIKRQCRILEVQSIKNYIFEIDKYVQMGLKKQSF